MNDRHLSKLPFLVVGLDGQLGRALKQELQARRVEFWSTSRRRASLNPRTFFLDLSVRPAPFLRGKVGTVFFCAAVTDMKSCENDPRGTRLINVEHMAAAARWLMSLGAFVIFPSTSAVFSGKVPKPDERTVPDPQTEYGRQKAEAESALLSLDPACNRLAVVRMTKVVTTDVAVFRTILAGLRAGRTVEPFSDLSMSPISLDFAVSGMMAIATQGIGGIFHLSGESTHSYAEVARRIACLTNCPESLVSPVTSEERGVKVPFKPQYAELGMDDTRSRLGLQPQRLDDVLASLIASPTNI